MIINVYKTESQLNPNILIHDIVKKAAYSTGVSKCSVYRVIKEYKSTHILKSPQKVKPRKKFSESVGEFERNAIRRKFHDFFFRHELPTIDEVLAAVSEDTVLGTYHRTKFYNLLKELHFKYVQRGCDSMLIDRDDIILCGRRYLRTVRSLRCQGRSIYYLDETWLNEGHTGNNVWVDGSVISSKQAFLSGLTTGSKAPSGKGRRLIITHIGSQRGFVDGCLWLIESL
jgi:transposase